MDEIAIVVASIGIGLSLGFIGAGGSILTIPVFVYILKKDPLSSGIYSMFVVGVSAMAGSIQSLVKKLVDFSALFAFGIPSISGAFIARKLIFPLIPHQILLAGSIHLSKEVLFMILLAALMIFSAVRMMKTISANKGGAIYYEQRTLLVFTGFVVGIITGLAGIGGGFLIVPALVVQAGLPVKKAIHTAFLIIMANSLISFISSYSTLDIEWLLLLKISLGAITGILIGTKLSGKMNGDLLKKIFAWVVLLIAAYILYMQVVITF